jgi:hypothetical protein
VHLSVNTKLITERWIFQWVEEGEVCPTIRSLMGRNLLLWWIFDQMMGTVAIKMMGIIFHYSILYFPWDVNNNDLYFLRRCVWYGFYFCFYMFFKNIKLVFFMIFVYWY